MRRYILKGFEQARVCNVSHCLCESKRVRTAIDQKQVYAQAIRLPTHMPYETSIITPVRAIVLLFQMARKPTVRVCSVQEVDLSPRQRSFWQCRSILRLGLHAPNEARVMDVSLTRMARVAVVARQDWQRIGRGLNESGEPHREEVDAENRPARGWADDTQCESDKVGERKP